MKTPCKRKLSKITQKEATKQITKKTWTDALNQKKHYNFLWATKNTMLFYLGGHQTDSQTPCQNCQNNLKHTQILKHEQNMQTNNKNQQTRFFVVLKALHLNCLGLSSSPAENQCPAALHMLLVELAESNIFFLGFLVVFVVCGTFIVYCFFFVAV